MLLLPASDKLLFITPRFSAGIKCSMSIIVYGERAQYIYIWDLLELLRAPYWLIWKIYFWTYKSGFLILSAQCFRLN